MRNLLLVAFLSSCTGSIFGGSADEPHPMRPRVKDCGGEEPWPTARVYEGLKPACVGCHDVGAEVPSFGSSSNFEKMVARNARFVVAQKPDESALFEMLEGKAGATQMPPPLAYAALADENADLPSLADLRCWVQGLDPNAGPGEVSSSLNRRLYAEYLQANLYWALGLSPTDFATGGQDYGVEDPDGLSPRSPRAQYRMQQLGAPHWLAGVARANELGTTFVQVMIQLSQAWCMKVNASNRVFFKYAAASDGLSTTASTARVRENLAYVFERVTGDAASTETLDALIELFRLYDTGTPRAGWAATCAAIVRHPLSLTY